MIKVRLELKNHLVTKWSITDPLAIDAWLKARFELRWQFILANHPGYDVITFSWKEEK